MQNLARPGELIFVSQKLRFARIRNTESRIYIIFFLYNYIISWVMRGARAYDKLALIFVIKIQQLSVVPLSRSAVAGLRTRPGRTICHPDLVPAKLHHARW